MIVRCERCETRFKLDESRIPARGARVRCSRCKHAFFVTPPGVAEEELVHRVAAEAARAPAPKPAAPEPAWDLEDGPGATVARARKPTLPGEKARPAEVEDDSDWRFEDEVPGFDPGASEASLDLSGAQTSPSLARPDANEDSFAELGDPSTWDLLAGDAPAGPEPAPDPALPSVPAEPAPIAELAAPLETPAAAPRPAAAVEAPTPVPVASVAAAARAAAVPVAPRRPRSRPAAPHTAALGWAGLVLLVAATAWGALRSPASAGVALAPVAGFEVSEARARVVENAAAGPILVVSGRLRNPGSAPRALGAPLAVQLIDERGAAIAESQPAGPALPESRLREEAPEQLQEAQRVTAAGLAGLPVAAGAELAFDAVFTPAPREATRFVVTPQGVGPR